MKGKRIVFKDGVWVEEEVDWNEVEKMKKSDVVEKDVILKKLNDIVEELEKIKKVLGIEEEKEENESDDKSKDEVMIKEINQKINKLKEKGYEVSGLYEQ